MFNELFNTMLHKKNATLADFAKFDFYQIKLNMISKLMC